MGRSGCGDGVFTRALASLLPPHSIIHAVDRDAVAPRAARGGARCHDSAVDGDVTDMPWPFGPLDGQLLANLLHYVRDQVAFLRGCREQLTEHGRLLVVEATRARIPGCPIRCLARR